MKPHPLLLAALTAALACPAAGAATFHLTPAGAGREDGSSWENALPGSDLSGVVNTRMKSGDRLLMAGGDYPEASLAITSGGTAGQPKILEGVDRGSGYPRFTSTWTIDRPDKGATAVSLAAGVSHVTLKHLRVAGYCFGVRAGASPSAARQGLVFEDIDMERIRHGFHLSDCDRLRIVDCGLKRYSKHGFRFEAGCDEVLLRNCLADCSEGDPDWERKTELLPFGFVVLDKGTPNSGFRFEHCTSRNNMKSNQKHKYPNGDGFVVEGKNRDVTFLRCRAFRNQDAGFDLKVPDVRLTGCVATGHRRDFRIWYTGTLEDSFAGWSGTGLWNNGGPVTATRCTFLEHARTAAETDDESVANSVLADCLISSSSPSFESVLRKMELKDSVVGSLFPAADAKWDGEGTAMDSREHPDKGYHSLRAAAARP